MGRDSNISWTEHTWNPLRASRKDLSGKKGWICVKFGEGCRECYAHYLNQNTKFGNGLPYETSSLDKVTLHMSHDNGQTSIDWPLRLQKPSVIFPCSMTDWMAEFYPQKWQTLMLATMALASQHTFITLTKRTDNLWNMLLAINEVPNRAIKVPAEKQFTKAILRANKNTFLFENSIGKLFIEINQGFAEKVPAKPYLPEEKHTSVPWPPRNIIFGVSINTIREAENIVTKIKLIRRIFPDILLMISQEPALEDIDWEKLGLGKGDVNQIIWGGESGSKARPALVEGWEMLKEFGQKTGTKVFWKQAGSVFARSYNLKDSKGGDVTDPVIIEHFEPIQENIDMTGRLV